MEKNEIQVQSVGVLKLKKSIKIDGKDVYEIPYDFDKLSGNDIEIVFKEATRSGYMVSSSYELDPVIGGRMFAQAADLDFGDVKRFKLKDYTEAANIARAFFITELSGDQEEAN